MTPEADEILILGAGPSGCTAARLLASWGHAVRLIARPHPPGAAAPGLAESLTPSCGKFFDLLGIREAIDAAGFVKSTGNTVWWGTTTARVESFANNATGWQVTAPRLEAVMRSAAIDAGARVDERLLDADEAERLPAAFRLDCTGRAGLLARSRASRVSEPGHRTVALSAVWRRETPWPVADDSHTLIESYADGWAWSVPLGETRRAVAVMVDPQTSSLTRGGGSLATYVAEIEKTTRFRGLLADAVREGGPAGWDASMYRSTTYAGEGWLVVGDAASFVDPLSSAGVKKALASGWLAAITVHTCLRNPANAETARLFYAEREAEMYAGYLALTRRYLHEGAVGQRQPFWAERSEAGEWSDRRARDETEQAAVRAAYEDIRAAPELRLERGPDVRIEQRPAIAGSEIVLEPRIVMPGDSTGVRYLHDIDAVAMVELAPGCRQVPDLYEACVRRQGPIDLAAFLTTLATAVARRWLSMTPGDRP